MSLTATLNTATSGLLAAQTGLRAVSDNISNVNTPNYVRKVVNQAPVVVNGSGMGVAVTSITRVTDQYLQLASLTAGSGASRWDVFSQYMDNAQSLFGDPNSDSFFFNRLNDVYSAFSAAANDPSSVLQRNQSLSAVQDFLSEAQRINTQVTQLGQTMDARLSSDVGQVNDLLSQINKLNTDITRAKLVDQDSSGSENIQDSLITQLSALMNVKIAQRPGGGVDVRTSDGTKLAGDGAAVLSYNSTGSTKGYISVTPAGGGASQPVSIDSGEIRGLLDLRNTDLPGISDQLGEFVSKAVQQLNAASNAASAVPAPATLTGKQTGLDQTTAVSGFTGATTVAIVNAAGVVQRQVAIDFDAGTMSVDGGAATPFSPATFDADLTTALGGMGTATFTNGQLSIAASGGNGVAIAEGTSAKAGGQGFSQFFGLNDLITSTGTTTYETGMTTADAHGFTPGTQIVLRLAQPDGKPLRDVTVTVPAAPTMGDLLASLNSTTSGVGLYGSFGLDASGAMSFTPTMPTNATLSVVQDNTTRGGLGGPTMSSLFGIGDAERGDRANRFEVNPTLTADPTKMSFATLDLSVAAGQPALRPADGSGALAMAGSGDVATQFQAAGALGAISMTVSRYASQLGGSIGQAAASAASRKDSAAAVQTEADNRRQAVEGVNLDEELVNLTTYQQAFNASARMIQATKDLFDVLTNML